MVVNITEHRIKGSIVRIKLHNFMTYDDVELMPGAYLNMILGPNGTGKSAIVCCIIVGLAGEVSLTGRGGSPADFVKKNTNLAKTEIELFNGTGKNYVIERTIIITNRSQFKIDHKSEWKINGNSVKKVEVQTLTKKLNIKVDNLCQFLPQDSVTQFVKMNACELLLNTLKAAGDNKLVDDHQKLVEYTKDDTEKRLALENLERSCKENEVNAQRLESEVHQIREREKLVKLKTICNQKIHYARFREGKINYDKAQQERDKVSNDLKKVESTSEPYKIEAELHKKEEQRYRESIDNSNREVGKLMSILSEHQNYIELKKANCQEEFAKFKSKLNQETQRENSLKLKQLELTSIQDKLNETQDVDCTEQINELEEFLDKIRADRVLCKSEKDRIHDKIKNVEKDLEGIRSDADLIRDIKQKKAALLRSKNQDAWTLMDWLSKNSDKFEKHVSLPIMCEVNVKEPKFARIVESAIQRNELTAFVCQTVNDVKTLTKVAINQLKLKINVILAPEKTLEEFKREVPQDPELRKLGVNNYLQDLIDAPDPIMRYLCGNNNFHRIPVVEKCPESNLQILLRKCPRLYANDELYIVNKSRYDQQTITIRDHVREHQHLIYSLDPRAIHENTIRFKRLKESREAALQEQRLIFERDDRLKKDWQETAEKHRDLKNKHDQKRKLEILIERAREAIDKLKEEKIDIETERGKLNQSIKKINMQIVEHLAKIGSIYRDLVSFKEAHMSNLLLHEIAEKNSDIARKRYRDSQTDTARLKQDLMKAQSNVETFKEALITLEKIAEEKIPGFKRGKLDSTTKHKFSLVEEKNVEDLLNKKEDLEIRIQRIFNHSSNSILDEFNRHNSELKDKRARIAQLEHAIKDINNAREAIKKTWLPKLNEVIEVINANYEKFMSKLSYGGRVELSFNQTDPNNFAAYGIVILVKYRDDEKLIPLSSSRQSGGERSVATMIYMLALQTKTTAPFRCVDEINQGMDKDNERKVFELLVQTADSSSSQYFLVSPKLLSNLPYSEKMKIHVVFNGQKLDVNWNKCLNL